MVEVTRIPALCCPQCQSTRVKPGFTKPARNRAWIRDSRIWCYECMHVTDTKTGKSEKHKYNPLMKAEWENE